MNLKFWTRLRDYCEKRMKEFYPASWKCPHCNTWTHTVGGVEDMFEGKGLNSGYTFMVCRRCDHTSKWRVEGPVSYHVEEES